MRAVPILLLVVLVGGCEIWDPRPGLRDFFWGIGDESVPDPSAEIRKKEYHTWPEPIRKAVDDRLVLIGMTRNQALVATRLAEKDIQKQATDTANGNVESWVVWRLADSWAYLKVRNSQKVIITFREGAVQQIDVEMGKPEAAARPLRLPTDPQTKSLKRGTK